MSWRRIGRKCGRVAVCIEDPDMPVMKIVQQWLKGHAWNFTGPDDPGVVYVGGVVNPLRIGVVIRRIVHDDQVGSWRCRELRNNPLSILQHGMRRVYVFVGYRRQEQGRNDCSSG